MPLFRVTPRWTPSPGTYEARLVSWMPCPDEGDVDVVWYFQPEISHPSGAAVRLSYATGTLVNPGSPVAMVLRALGVPVPRTDVEAAAIDPDTLVGRRCRIRVENSYFGETPRAVVKAVLPSDASGLDED